MIHSWPSHSPTFVALPVDLYGTGWFIITGDSQTSTRLCKTCIVQSRYLWHVYLSDIQLHKPPLWGYIILDTLYLRSCNLLLLLFGDLEIEM